jgi:internalin A
MVNQLFIHFQGRYVNMNDVINELNCDFDGASNQQCLDRLCIKLDLSSNKLRKIEFVEDFKVLECFLINDNQLKTLAGSKFNRPLKYFTAIGNDIKSIGKIDCPGLILMDLENNSLNSTSGIHGAPNLVSFNARTNDLKNLENIDGCKNLGWIDCSDNNLTTISSLPNCRHLQEVNLKSNDLSNIKEIIALIQNCSNLKVLNISDNDYDNNQLNQVSQLCQQRGIQLKK